MRALLVFIVVSGCAAQTGQTTCNASNWRALVGEPEEALYGALGNLRVIRHGEVVSDDMNPDRLNAVIGADGRIKEFGCY